MSDQTSLPICCPVSAISATARRGRIGWSSTKRIIFCPRGATTARHPVVGIAGHCPDHRPSGTISTDALRLVTAVIALGPKAKNVVKAFCKGAGTKPPKKMSVARRRARAVLAAAPQETIAMVKVIEPRQSLKRHSRKYAEGQLDEAGSFYFRGPDNAMNLRAHNLMIFPQIAEGIDDKTWEHHLRAGDYSEWFRRQIRDKELARETQEAEKDERLSAQESRKHVLDAVRAVIPLLPPPRRNRWNREE